MIIKSHINLILLFFEKIDTPEKAYWLGFLAADGSCSERSLRLTLAKRDHSHVEKFKARLLYEGPIRELAKKSSICISNTKLVGDLISHGVLRRKTFKLDERILTNLDRKMKRFFILGYLDGDGCVSIAKSGYAYFSFCGSLELMEEIRLCFAEDVGVFFSPPKKRKNIFVIHLHVNEDRSKRIFNYLYVDSSKDFLERKKEKLIEKIEKYKEDHFPEKTKQYIKTREINDLNRLIKSAQNRLSEIKSAS